MRRMCYAYFSEFNLLTTVLKKNLDYNIWLQHFVYSFLSEKIHLHSN